MAAPTSPEDIRRQRVVVLLARVAQRDAEAFRQLYDATKSKLYGIILRILPDREVANDILQEVFVKIWDRASDFDPARASPITWMATIARNRALDEARRVRPMTVADDDTLLAEAADMEHPLDSRSRSEELQRLLACLSGLDEERRQIVLLAYYRGMTRDALSRRFNRPVPTIKTLLYRSLAQLRECLGHG